MKNDASKNGIKLLLALILISSILNTTVISHDSNLNEITFSKNEVKERSDITGDFIFTLNGKSYIAEYITKERLEEIKENVILRDINKNYNDIVDDHGTGLAPPTERELDKLLGKVSILGALKDSNFQFPATAVDLSTEIYFAPVGDQAMQGSCTAWANVYYAYGYMEAKDYGWDASSGNTDYLLSPAWVYNKIAAFDYGSMPIDAGELVKQWGVATMTTMPYDDMDYYSWGEEAAWREAPYHRALNFSLITYIDFSSINTIKSFLDAGIPITFGIDAYEFWNGLNDTSGDYILSSEEYLAIGGLNHAQCIVGYDDSISEGSDTGAFRVVNSWGEEWMDDGFYWMTYNAFHEIGNYTNQFIGFYTDMIDYQPTLISTWEFSAPPTRMNDIITLGVGPHDTPLDNIIPLYDNDENYLFPEFMALDVSDFQSYYNMDNDVFFFLEIGSSTTGRISSFQIERYVGGIIVENAYSLDVPSQTPGYVYCTFKDFTNELKVIIDIPKDVQICNTYMINATISNNGINNESNVEFYLYLDSILIDSTIIVSLPAGEKEKLNYLWIPNQRKTYNFTAYAPPVLGENYTTNNYKTELITIYQNYYMYDGYPYNWVDATGGIPLSITSDDGYATLSLPFSFPFYDQNFSTIYLGANGYLSFTDSSPSDYSNDPIPSSDSDNYYLIAPFWDDLLTVYAGGGGNIYVQSFGTYWVAEWYDIEHIDGHLIGTFEVILYESGDIVFNYDEIRYVGEGYTCGLNLGLDTRIYNSYTGLSASIDDFSINFTYEQLNHDLSVTVETPLNPKRFETYIISATVANEGPNHENNVFLFLYLDNIVVNSTTIPSLNIGESETIIYEWTPTSYEIYNFTAIALPVPEEIYVYNNYFTKEVPILDSTLFSGMYISYIFDFVGTPIETNFSYSYISGNLFHVNWDFIMGNEIYQGFWDIDYQTRRMYNPGGVLYFNPGNHTPIWIFTNAHIGSRIPIAVDGENEHIFRVSRSLVYELPGFGNISIWELVDQTLPGGIAWYEQSTGILINGTFFYADGAAYYSFDFVDTNVEFGSISEKEEDNVIPGYNLFIILGILCVISVFSLKIKCRSTLE